MIDISIDGMSCENCVRHVREALAGLPGVEGVEVDLAAGKAQVQGGGEVSDDGIIEALDEEGYDVTGIVRG
jgi:copper chaperone CopZ